MSTTTQDRESMLSSQGNHCFVCGPSNPIGLGIEFRIEGDLCVAEFTPRSEHMGYNNVTHGGIVFSMLDDVMANWLWLRGRQCFTGRADIRYRAELPIGTPILLEGRCLKSKARLSQMQGRVMGAEDGFVFAEATGAFMTPAT